MMSHEKATLINSKLTALESKLVYPPQNLVDLIWKAKPVKPDAAIYIQSVEFAGAFLLLHFFFGIAQSGNFRQGKLREWIKQQPSSAPSYLKAQDPGRQYVQVATLVTSLACIGMIAFSLFFRTY